MTITVLSPGTLSMVQDLGRFGYQHQGLTQGGPMDAEAFYWANRLLGNPENDAQIEVTLGGLTLQAQAAIQVALTGATTSMTINGSPAKQWQSHQLHAGDILSLGYASEGCRSYLAVSGGIQIAPQWGSVATVLREQIGGLNGKPLAKGDVLNCTSSSTNTLQRLPDAQIPRYKKSIELRLVVGYQYALFSRVAQRTFFSSTYHITVDSDRMGVKLAGAKINHSLNAMLSEGIALGAVQIPPDGQPIILLQDRQTIGGYSKMGSVLSTDLNKLAQLQLGDEVRFVPISVHCAHNALALAAAQRQSTQLIKLC